MMINWTLVVEGIKVVAWPLVAAFVFYLFRRPLGELLADFARRARKVSIFEVSIELATLPELKPVWSVQDHDVRQLTPSSILDSFSQTLYEELLRPRDADYAIVDLGSGREWLTSRLFVFAVILGEVTKLRAFVFLENSAGVRRRFLGIATAANVRRALGLRYPWFEESFARALISVYGDAPQVAKPGAQATSTFSNRISPLATPPDVNSVRQFVVGFVNRLQRNTEPPAAERGSYECFVDDQKQPVETIWERAQWINGERLERDLGGVLDYAWLEDSPDIPRRLMSEAVMRRAAPLVALVDTDRRFRGVVDRYVLLGEAFARGSLANKIAPDSR